ANAGPALVAEGPEIVRSRLSACDRQLPFRLLLRVPAEAVRPGHAADPAATLRGPDDAQAWSGLARLTLDPAARALRLRQMVRTPGLPREPGMLLRLEGLAIPLAPAEAASGMRHGGAWAGRPAEFHAREGRALRLPRLRHRAVLAGPHHRAEGATVPSWRGCAAPATPRRARRPGPRGIPASPASRPSAWRSRRAPAATAWRT
ncbi:MAG: hypothetical protein NZM27_11915, partial [Acetobacteraceae bacterium]|nr:hypothetical protein [Acetobacteraceae bacterium]